MSAINSMRMPVALLSLVMGLLLLAMPAQAQGLCEDFHTIDNPDDATIREYQRDCVTGSKQESKAAEKDKEASYRPPDVTCPHLPASVSVANYGENTQCQMVDEAGLGRMDLIQRGIIQAVDVWNSVTGTVEVCFRNAGLLVFLDATYVERLLTDLESYERDGMTCGKIDRIGTVVLLDSPAAPTEQPAENALPLYDSTPQSICQIKLIETLFLRAEPAGEIIGLVWLYSEVPVFKIRGDWYFIEFQGQVGYISRDYRKVLWGDCA